MSETKSQRLIAELSLPTYHWQISLIEIAEDWRVSIPKTMFGRIDYNRLIHELSKVAYQDEHNQERTE